MQHTTVTKFAGHVPTQGLSTWGKNEAGKVTRRRIRPGRELAQTSDSRAIGNGGQESTFSFPVPESGAGGALTSRASLPQARGWQRWPSTSWFSWPSRSERTFSTRPATLAHMFFPLEETMKQNVTRLNAEVQFQVRQT